MCGASSRGSRRFRTRGRPGLPGAVLLVDVGRGVLAVCQRHAATDEGRADIGTVDEALGDGATVAVRIAGDAADRVAGYKGGEPRVATAPQR